MAVIATTFALVAVFFFTTPLWAGFRVYSSNSSDWTAVITDSSLVGGGAFVNADDGRVYV